MDCVALTAWIIYAYERAIGHQRAAQQDGASRGSRSADPPANPHDRLFSAIRDGASDDDIIACLMSLREEDRLQLVKQLAVTLNHEVNNPLFVASATLEDVLAGQLEEEIASSLRTALEAIWRAGEAIKQLQEVRRVVTATYIPGYSMIDLAASQTEPPPDA